HGALHEVPGVSAVLYSSPAGNQALRLSDTFVGLFEKAKRLDDLLSFDHRAIESARPRGLGSLIFGVQRGSRRDSAETRHPDSIQTLQAEVRKLTGNVAADFNHESGGLVPMAETAARLEAKEARVGAISNWFHQATASAEENRALLHPREQRLFDVALMRRELRGADTLFVEKTMAIMALRRYVVRVQIGRPLAQSIVAEHGPDVDSQVPPPPPGGHLLTVVLYPFDFDCKSPTMQSFRLPERGPSEPVYFEVVAPSRYGRAEMRVALYYELPPEAPETETHRNHLLQSYLIESKVMQSESRQPTEVTVARLEVARRPSFDTLPTLGPRIASLGINASTLRPDEHRFTLKGTEVGSWVSIPEQTIQSAIDDIRRLFGESTRRADGDNARFPKDFTPSERAGRQADFESVIRKMATAGSDLYWRIWKDRPGASTEENTKHQQALVDIRERSDETIQIMRYDLNYVFPWALLYDFLLPADPVKAPVCDGFLRTVEGRPIRCAECLEQCHHDQGGEAICVWGFWGLRHEVEQLLHGEAASVANVIEPLRDGGVLLSVGIASSEFFNEAVTTLEGSFGKAILKLGDEDEPGDILWSDSGRPAMAVFLGHHDATEGGDWHLSLPGNRWLENRSLKNRLQQRAGAYWSDPHTVVLLAACGTAPADLRKLSTFVDTFAQAKASAVIGTEVVVFEGLAADLATSLVTSMLREGPTRSTLGKAVLDFRRQLLLQLSPLGFVVTPYGDADIRLAAKGDA
ncbi:MAG: hypothetical protein JWN02_756, partial [Acidobacteria bacterium]|nr:hypothetical protein [Acidobacteriota bacterium]